MRRYADPQRCPDCLSAITYGAPRCPSCGLSLEGSLASELFSTLSHADDLLADLRAASTTDLAVPVPAAAHAAGPPPAGVSVLTRPPAPARPAGRPAAPGPARAHHPTLSGASVPRILLALGALCLLVAALVFLAVTWSAMGVGGRTATLVGFTAVAGLLAAWAARRELRAAAESLTVVALGLASFDLFGARDAGWLGAIDTPDFLVVLGAVVAAAGSAAALATQRHTPLPTLVSAQVMAAFGIAAVVTGAATADRLGLSARLVLAVLLAAAAALAARALSLTVVAVGGWLVALFTWVLLALSSWDRAVEHTSFRELWLEQEAWPLVAAAVLVSLPAFATRLNDTARLAALGTGAVVWSTAAFVPFLDESATTLTTAGAVLVAVLALLALAVPLPWRRSLAGPGVLGAAALSVAGLGLAGVATARVVESGAALWSGSAADDLPLLDGAQPAGWVLPVLVVSLGLALVAAARSFAWADRAVAPLADADALGAAAAATFALALALYPVPAWLVLGVLLATGATLLARAVLQQRALPLALASIFLALGLQLSLHAQWLTLVAVLVLLAGALVLHLRTARLDVAVGAGAVASTAAAGLAWTVGALVGLPETWAAVTTILTLTLLTLGGPYVDERLRVTGPATYARLGTEVGALASAAVVSLAALDPVEPSPTWSAIFLTLTGAGAAAMAVLRPDRRAVGWLGGLLLAAASWVRLADLGVETPEAYTLPSAVALLVVGLVHLRRHSDAATVPTLGAGLALGLVPSLLWSLADPVSWRSLVLGAATLALVLLGVRLRWSAPLVAGAVTGAVLVVRLATPIAEAVPRWALIGLAGAVLVTLGITWEKRLRDARAVAGYVRSLR